MKLVLATSLHAPGIAAVHVRAWQAAYGDILDHDFLSRLSIADRTKRWERNLTEDPATTAIALFGDEIIGFASWGPCRDESPPAGRGEVWAVYVDPQHWRKGIGAALLEQAIRALDAQGYREAALWVLKLNLRAVTFYERRGFSRSTGGIKVVEIGRRRVEEEQYVRAFPTAADGGFDAD